MDTKKMEAETVMGVFKAFGAERIPNVRITKIGCVEGHPPKIPVGQVIAGTFTHEVEVGTSFNLKNATVMAMMDGRSIPDTPFGGLKGFKYKLWCTSIIQKVLSDNTFQTKNSIYKWEVI